MMGIQFFDVPETGTGELVFATEYLTNHPKEQGKVFRVKEVRLAQSNKGYMLYTDAFIGWLFKRNPIAVMLVQALEVYVRDTYGYAIVIELDKGADKSIKVGVDASEPCMWYGTGKKFTLTPDIPTFDPTTGNPFLIPLAPSTPTTSTANVNTTQDTNSQQKRGKTT